MARRTRQHRAEQEPETVPVPPSKPAPVVPVAPVRAPEPRVRIRNLTSQLVECSVLSEGGQSAAVRVLARGVSEPFHESQISHYTRSLADRGYLRIEPAR